MVHIISKLTVARYGSHLLIASLIEHYHSNPQEEIGNAFLYFVCAKYNCWAPIPVKYLYIHWMTLSLTFSLSMKCSVSQFIARIKSRLYMQDQFLANIVFEKNDILRRKIKNRPYSKAKINRFIIRGYAMLLLAKAKTATTSFWNWCLWFILLQLAYAILFKISVFMLDVAHKGFRLQW